jgi:hypothetical protein
MQHVTASAASRKPSNVRHLDTPRVRALVALDHLRGLAREAPVTTPDVAGAISYQAVRLLGEVEAGEISDAVDAEARRCFKRICRKCTKALGREVTAGDLLGDRRPAEVVSLAAFRARRAAGAS